MIQTIFYCSKCDFEHVVFSKEKSDPRRPVQIEICEKASEQQFQRQIGWQGGKGSKKLSRFAEPQRPFTKKKRWWGFSATFGSCCQVWPLDQFIHFTLFCKKNYSLPTVKSLQNISSVRIRTSQRDSLSVLGFTSWKNGHHNGCLKFKKAHNGPFFSK